MRRNLFSSVLDLEAIIVRVCLSCACSVKYALILVAFQSHGPRGNSGVHRGERGRGQRSAGEIKGHCCGGAIKNGWAVSSRNEAKERDGAPCGHF